MQNTAVALVLAHLLADFVLQSDAMVRDKRTPRVLLLHGAIVAATAWAALGLAPHPGLILMITASHLLIDWLKLRLGGPGFAPFILDQSAHLAMIALGAALLPSAWQAGLWGMTPPPTLAPLLARLPEAMTLGAALIAAVWAGGYAVASLMLHLTQPTADSLPRGGRLIGRLERLMILMLVLMGQPDGIGFLIAAKSILRFGDVSRADGDGDGRRVSEYVIIGTLASFAWALAVSYATTNALAAMQTP